MSEQLDRPKLTRAILKTHEIYYHEQVYVPNSAMSGLSLPYNVNKLREAILDFSGIQISNGWKQFFQDQETQLRAHHQSRDFDGNDLDLQPPTSAYFDEEEFRYRTSSPDYKTEIDRLNSNIVEYKNIAGEASRLGYDSESGWMDFLKSKFFKRFERQHDRDDVYFHEFGLEENVLWNESKRAFQWEENFTPGIRERTGPKPDLSYGFKASQFGNNQRGFRGMPHFQNLSFDVLGELRARTPAMQSTVTTGLSNWHQWRAKNRDETTGKVYPGKLLTPDFLCFPWAIVEVKHAQGTMSAEEYCQCQLANATTCAYDLQEKLIRSVDDSCAVDPIIGFTCIGPRVRLWLTYRGDDSKINMVCVWASSLDSTWGALCLTEVIDYMQIWASRILRGKIAQYIDWTYRRGGSTTPNTMPNTGKSPHTPFVKFMVGTSTTTLNSSGSIGSTSAKEMSSGRGSTTQATGSNPVPVKRNRERKIRVSLPPALDAESSTAKSTSDGNQTGITLSLDNLSLYPTLAPPQHPLRHSCSENNLTAKAKSSTSSSKYTIFDKLGRTPTPYTPIVTPSSEIPAQPKGDKAQLDQHTPFDLDSWVATFSSWSFGEGQGGAGS